jgi:hypothetical protein
MPIWIYDVVPVYHAEFSTVYVILLKFKGESMQILVGGDNGKKIANKKQESKFHVKIRNKRGKIDRTVETQNHIRKTV